MNLTLRAAGYLFAFLWAPFAFTPARSLPQAAQAMLEGSSDIGSAQKGASAVDPAAHGYRLSGGGDDVWGTADAFRYTWRRISGDATIAADVHLDAPATYRLAKGMLMFRQSLEPGSPYADIAVHADGHITLQYRLTAGGETRDVTLPEHGSVRLRIVRDGDRFTAYAGASQNPASISIRMGDPLYVGVGVCSHNTQALQTATFSNVSVEQASRQLP